MKISSITQMQLSDQKAVETYGIQSIQLMENAGSAAVHLLKSKIHLKDKNITILCGTGNNGGDGLVAARHLHSLNSNVQIILLSSPDSFQGSALQNFQTIQEINLPCIQVKNVKEIDAILASSDLIIDAIFGTGLTRSIEGLFAEVIQAVNLSHLPVLSLDIPSGVNGDTGEIMGTAIQATWTVTFGLPKTGNLLYPGFEKCGELYVNHISFPLELLDSDAMHCSVNIPPKLPFRKPDGHKGTFGEVLVIAGAASYYGAPYFSSMAFLKSGGGYVRLAAPAALTPFIAMKGSEIVFLPQKETDRGGLNLANKPTLLEYASNSDFIILGPGLSLGDEPQQLARQIISESKKPLLIDGDGLSALGKDPTILTERQGPSILTPHPGEMARLIGRSTDTIQKHAIDIAREYSVNWNTLLVLKGAHSIIATPEGEIYINMTGNSGMATAGSGDVLTGVIAAMYCLGLDIKDAVKKGVFMHGFAGDLAADSLGPDGITAQDILDFLPRAMKQDRKENLMEKYPTYAGAIMT